MPMSQNREGREFRDGVGGEIELGGVEWRKEGGKMCLIQKEGKKWVHLVLLFFVEHLALTLPLLSATPSHPPPQTHTDRHAGVQQTHRIPRQRALSAFTTELKAG